MNILGIRCGHDASVSLVQDGKIVADVSEERFTRVKNDTSFPINAIAYCLTAGGIRSEDIDVIALPSLAIPDVFFVFFTFPETFHQEQVVAKIGKGRQSIVQTETNVRRPEPPFTPHVTPILPIYHHPFRLSDKCRVFLIEHHLCHAASACYTSGLDKEKALAVTLDGCGDGVSAAIWRFENNGIECIEKFDRSASLGWFYANATEGMGWRHGSDEWKIMGLAPYGKPQPGALKGFYPEYADGYLARPHRYGAFGRWNDHGANHYHGKDAAGLQKIFQKLGAEDYAAEVQRISEEQAFNLILPWLERENTRHLLCAGGFFLNVKFNQKLWYSGKLDRQWVYPNAGDSGLAVGAALYAHHAIRPDEKMGKLDHLYLGPEYANSEIETILKDRGLVYEWTDDPSGAAAAFLQQNRVVGWFQGRMESGPRALGHRSILMSPLRAENKDIINHKIKYREHFRPFAPAMPVEHMHDYLINPREEFFMTCAFEVVPEKRNAIPAVVHVDHTVRPQMVSRQQNQRYYDLIKAFGELTGETVVLNTSFNVKGEPIVNHPRDAIRCFFDTGLDILVMNNFICKKPALSAHPASSK